MQCILICFKFSSCASLNLSNIHTHRKSICHPSHFRSNTLE